MTRKYSFRFWWVSNIITLERATKPRLDVCNKNMSKVSSLRCLQVMFLSCCMLHVIFFFTTSLLNFISQLLFIFYFHHILIYQVILVTYYKISIFPQFDRLEFIVKIFTRENDFFFFIKIFLIFYFE